MVAIPFFYFLGVFAYFLYKERKWNLDLAATSLLLLISLFAIVIDIRDLYGSYGINEDYMTLPTVLLFCLQWTIVLWPVHLVSKMPLREHPQIKKKLLYILFFILIISSVIIIAQSFDDIKMALIMDQAEVYSEHIDNITEGAHGAANYILLFPKIFVSTPFPTLALFLWFYMSAFMDCSLILRIGMLIASIVQAILSIVIAGRGAIVFWTFDFFLISGYFYQYLSKKLKREITLASLLLIGLIGILFISITIARFDTIGRNTNALDSFYGYAGQQVNNFCTMFVKGSDSPFQIGRILPLTAKILYGQTFDLIGHYDRIAAHVDAYVNVFDTFGAELYLDLGFVGYISFFLLVIIGTFYMQAKWKEMSFCNIFILIIIISFITRGFYSWPFTGHYTTLAILMLLANSYLYKYTFKI